MSLEKIVHNTAKKPIDFAGYLEKKGNEEAQLLRPCTDFIDDLMNEIENPNAQDGATLPWVSTHDKVRFRDGDVTIWAGENGHFKSMVLGMVAAWFTKKEKVCIASLEMQPRHTLMRMAMQVAGCVPSKEYATKWLNWEADKLVIYDQLDTVAAPKVLGAIWYAAKELGCKHIIIDSFTLLGISRDSDAETALMSKLVWCAKTLNIHIHLVCHLRKPHSAGDDYRPSRYDIRGAGQLSDLAASVILCKRNMIKERALKTQEAGFLLKSDRDIAAINESDFKLIVDKQRHGIWEGDIGLWVNKKNMQFLADSSGQRLPFTLD